LLTEWMKLLVYSVKKFSRSKNVRWLHLQNPHRPFRMASHRRSPGFGGTASGRAMSENMQFMINVDGATAMIGKHWVKLWRAGVKAQFRY